MIKEALPFSPANLANYHPKPGIDKYRLYDSR
jgi:hypothetical protein